MAADEENMLLKERLVKEANRRAAAEQRAFDLEAELVLERLSDGDSESDSDTDSEDSDTCLQQRAFLHVLAGLGTGESAASARRVLEHLLAEHAVRAEHVPSERTVRRWRGHLEPLSKLMLLARVQGHDITAGPTEHR